MMKKAADQEVKSNNTISLHTNVSSNGLCPQNKENFKSVRLVSKNWEMEPQLLALQLLVQSALDQTQPR
jgi:hypothetical protein